MQAETEPQKIKGHASAPPRRVIKSWLQPHHARLMQGTVVCNVTCSVSTSPTAKRKIKSE